MLTAEAKRAVLVRVHVPELVDAVPEAIPDIADRIMRLYPHDGATKSDIVELLVDARARIVGFREPPTR